MTIPAQQECVMTVPKNEQVDNVQQWLDSNPRHPDRRNWLKQFVDLSEERYLPSSLFIDGLRITGDGIPVAGGSFSDVFKGTYNGRDVAIKRFRFFLPAADCGRDKMYRRFCREALVWRQLRHRCPLPFFGVDHAAFHSKSSLIIASPWMAQGTLMEYLVQKAGGPVAHEHLISDVASGLRYLHAQTFAHGDLHGSNIYIDEHDRAVLGDFGLTAITDTAFQAVTTTINKAGASRWLSPELIYQGDSAPPRKILPGDVFAFGRLCLSVYTRRVPFDYIAADPGVILRVITNQHPDKPTREQCHGTPIPDGLWDLATRCWSANPAERPQIKGVLESLKTISGWRNLDV